MPPAEKRTRRAFTAAEKLRILQEPDACQQGELGEVPRLSGVYSSRLVCCESSCSSGGGTASDAERQPHGYGSFVNTAPALQ